MTKTRSLTFLWSHSYFLSLIFERKVKDTIPAHSKHGMVRPIIYVHAAAFSRNSTHYTRIAVGRPGTL